MKMPEDQYALYAEFGITAEKAQVLELEAGNVALYFVALFIGTDEITPELTDMYRSLITDVDSRTLGALFKHIKKYFNLDDTIIQTLDEGLEKRNYLTHHFFRTHNFALFSEEGRQSMLAELNDIQSKLDKAHTTLSMMSQILNEMAGRPKITHEQALQFQSRGKKLGI